MRKLVVFPLCFIMLIGIGCNSMISKKDAKDKLETLFNMPISDSFYITDYETNTAIGGDYTEVFIVHFKKEEFNEIFNKIKPEKFNYIDTDKYGYTIEQNSEMISAIFNPVNYSIKYTYNYE